MIPVLSVEEAFSLELVTINSGLLSEKQLMDNAGRSIAQFIIEHVHNPFNQKFIIISGPGNNGGDGIICHHYLKNYGVNSQILLLNQSVISKNIIQNYSIPATSILLYDKEYIFSNNCW